MRKTGTRMGRANTGTRINARLPHLRNLNATPAAYLAARGTLWLAALLYAAAYLVAPPICLARRYLLLSVPGALSERQ